MSRGRCQWSPIGPGKRLSYLALVLCGLNNVFLLVATAMILNNQSSLSQYNKISDWMGLPLLEHDEATNNYRRSFNALFAVMQAGLMIETYLAVRSRNTLHFYLLALYHLYCGVHAFQEQSLWQYMINTYQDERKRNSPTWLETAVVVGVTTAAVEWVLFAAAFQRLWGWRRLRRCGEAPTTRRMFILHHVHSKLVKVSPFLLLGYVNRLVIQLPTADGDSGLRMDFLRLSVGLAVLAATIIVPAHIGLHRESKPLTLIAIVNIGIFFVVSTAYYVIGLYRELQKPPANPWGDIALHSVTVLFFVLGMLLMPGLILLALLNMRHYDMGLKELRTSQTLLDDEDGEVQADVDLNINASAGSSKDQQPTMEPKWPLGGHQYPPAAVHHSRLPTVLPGRHEGSE